MGRFSLFRVVACRSSIDEAAHTRPLTWVSLTTAVLLLAVIAGLVSAMVNEMTIRAGLLKQPQ